MKLKLVLALAWTLALAGTGCSRNRQEAVILANQADKEVTLNPEGASSKYEQATKLDPTSHQIFFKLANAYKKKEEWDKMASALSRAAQLAPKFANYWFWRGWALEQQARKKTIQWEEAKEPYTKCIEADPNFADCYSQLGTVMLFTDDEQKALENFTKAIEHDPTKLQYFAQLADLYIRLGLGSEAEQLLKEAKNFAKPGDKDVFDIHVLLAMVYQDKGSTSEMVAELEAAKAAVPGDSPEGVQVLYNLGSAYAATGQKKQEAIQMLKGFQARACKSASAAKYKTECESAQALISKLGGTSQ
jgi:tetratricopeptide (TPR) repeat protein